MADERFGIKKHYDPVGQYTYILVRDIPKEYRDEFVTWLTYQTRPYIEELGAEQDGAFSWDFDRWYKMKFMLVPTYWD